MAKKLFVIPWSIYKAVFYISTNLIMYITNDNSVDNDDDDIY